MDGFGSTIGIYSFEGLKLLNMPIRQGIIRSAWDEVTFIDRDPHWYSRFSQSERGYSHNTSPKQHQQVRPASSPVARDLWGIFELIIKESEDEGSDGKGRKSEATFPSLSFSFPSLPARALRSFPSFLARASRLFRVLASSPIPSQPQKNLWRRQQVRQCKFFGIGQQTPGFPQSAVAPQIKDLSQKRLQKFPPGRLRRQNLFPNWKCLFSHSFPVN